MYQSSRFNYKKMPFQELIFFSCILAVHVSTGIYIYVRVNGRACLELKDMFSIPGKIEKGKWFSYIIFVQKDQHE